MTVSSEPCRMRESQDTACSDSLASLQGKGMSSMTISDVTSPSTMASPAVRLVPCSSTEMQITEHTPLSGPLYLQIKGVLQKAGRVHRKDENSRANGNPITTWRMPFPSLLKGYRGGSMHVQNPFIFLCTLIMDECTNNYRHGPWHPLTFLFCPGPCRHANKAARYAALRKRLVRQHHLTDPLLQSTTSASTSATVTPWSTPCRNPAMDPVQQPPSATPTDTTTSGSTPYPRHPAHAFPCLSSRMASNPSMWGTSDTTSHCQTSPTTTDGSGKTNPQRQDCGYLSVPPMSPTNSPPSTAEVRRDSGFESASPFSPSPSNSTLSTSQEETCQGGFLQTTRGFSAPSRSSLARGPATSLWYDSRWVQAIGAPTHERARQEPAAPQAFRSSPPWSASPTRSSRGSSRRSAAFAKGWGEAGSILSSEGSHSNGGTIYPRGVGVKLHLLTSARQFV
jgi:hypothetical protein